MRRSMPCHLVRQHQHEACAFMKSCLNQLALSGNMPPTEKLPFPEFQDKPVMILFMCVSLV